MTRRKCLFDDLCRITICHPQENWIGSFFCLKADGKGLILSFEIFEFGPSMHEISFFLYINACLQTPHCPSACVCPPLELSDQSQRGLDAWDWRTGMTCNIIAYCIFLLTRKLLVLPPNDNIRHQNYPQNGEEKNCLHFVISWLTEDWVNDAYCQ